MRLILGHIVLVLILLAVGCQALGPQPIPALPDQPPTRPAVLPPAPPGGPSPAASPRAAATDVAPATNPGMEQRRAEVVVALAREPLSLDPGDVVDPGGLIVLRQIFDTLTQYKEGSADIEPGLATSWQANADATEWTFTLRSGVTFHDGTALDAEAVKFNLSRWLDPDFRPGNRAEGKQFQVWSDVFGGYRGAGSLVTEVTVVAPDQVRLKLGRPASYLPALLALPYFGLSSPAAVTKLGARYGAADGGAVGTGPFRFVDWNGGRVRLERNAGYWGGAPAARTLDLQAFGEVEAQLAALASGRADLAPDIPLAKAAGLGEGAQAVARPLLAVVYLGVNQRFRPFDDGRVRQALAAALDPAALAQGGLPGAAPADQFLPPGLWGRLPTTDTPRDVSRARALLSEAGFKAGLNEIAGTDGVARPLELWYSNPPQGVALAPLARAVATQLAEAGVQVRLREDEWTSYLAERKQGRFPLYLLVYPIPSARVEAVGDPQLFLNALFGPLTVSETGYDNERLRAQLRQAEATADRAAREDLYRQIGATVQADRPRLPLVYPTGVAVTRRGVTGYQPSPLFTESLARVKTES